MISPCVHPQAYPHPRKIRFDALNQEVFFEWAELGDLNRKPGIAAHLRGFVQALAVLLLKLDSPLLFLQL